jgi:hypothetical protein
MRTPYVHVATVVMSADDDDGAPGAAIPLALCGSWERPPCPRAAHHTQPVRHGKTLDLRGVFATEPEHQAEVRRLINAALRTGAATDPNGVTSHCALCGSKPGVLTPSERAQGCAWLVHRGLPKHPPGRQVLAVQIGVLPAGQLETHFFPPARPDSPSFPLTALLSPWTDRLPARSISRMVLLSRAARHRVDAVPVDHEAPLPSDEDIERKMSESVAPARRRCCSPPGPAPGWGSPEDDVLFALVDQTARPARIRGTDIGTGKGLCARTSVPPITVPAGRP